MENLTTLLKKFTFPPQNPSLTLRKVSYLLGVPSVNFTVNHMIASIFLLFLAFGITLASLLYGVGGIFPVLVALSAITIVARLLSQMISRRVPHPASG